MTREERIKSYQENIFSAILNPEGISKENFEYLLEVIPTYLKIVLDIEEVPIVYKEIKGAYGDYISGKNKINLSQDYFKYKEEENDNIILLSELVQCCTHELYHALDDREKKNSKSNRENQSLRHQQGIKYLSLFFPEKKQQYIEFVRAMYAISRSECFARQGALLMLKSVVKDMESYLKENLSGKNLGEQVEQILEYEEKALNTGDYEGCPNVEREAWDAHNMISKCAIFKTKTQYEEDKEKHVMKLAIVKRSMLSEIKEDLLKASEKVKASWNQIKDPFSEETLMYIASTQELADFYDEKILSNFADYASLSLDKKGLNYVCRCAELEQLKRKQKEQQAVKEEKQEL